MPKKFSPELRERAIRMVLDRHAAQGGPRSQSVRAVALQLGLSEQTLHTHRLPLLAPEHAFVSTGASRARQGLVHRSDRGSQRVSLASSDALLTAGVMASAGTVGDSYDNSLPETVNGLDKAELVYWKRVWESVEAVERATMEWFHGWNTSRLHEAPGCRTLRRPRTLIIAGRTQLLLRPHPGTKARTLHSALDAAKQDPGFALRLYLWSTDLSGAWHAHLDYVEVALRNALDTQLRTWNSQQIRPQGGWLGPR